MWDPLAGASSLYVVALVVCLIVYGEIIRLSASCVHRALFGETGNVCWRPVAESVPRLRQEPLQSGMD